MVRLGNSRKEKMFEINGKYTNAKIFTDNIEPEAISQIYELCNQSFAEGAKVRIMSDVHAGKGCVVGFTANLGNKVVANLIGVDIGCGMHVTELGYNMLKFSLKEFDEVVHNVVPAGKNSHSKPIADFEELNDLLCLKSLDTSRILSSIGTLGGGNHFIELNKDEDGYHYLVIHSGSRNLGKQVADHYQKMAIKYHSGSNDTVESKERLIKLYKEQGKEKLISNALKELDKKSKNQIATFPDHLAYLEGELRDSYLHDMAICQRYASLNRSTMADSIIDEIFTFGNTFDSFETIHNYINFSDNILRKGAVSAKKGEELIIPINMRDGSLLCVGKGNEDWNMSAPHGAGRLMSRSKARATLSMDDYQQEMKNVYSTTISINTLDEAPDAYKPMSQIIDNIGDTVDIIKIIKPVYNFKAGE